MKKAAFFRRGLLLIAFSGLLLVAGAMGNRVQVPDDQEANPQQIQKPTYDYMSNYLSRSTRPLCLYADPLTRELLNQKSAKWAVRAGVRHVLD